jgi:hypothetical protein
VMLMPPQQAVAGSGINRRAAPRSPERGRPAPTRR